MILYLPRLVLDVSKVFHLAQVVKPLMSIWSYMYLVNKNYGKDYPLAREDIHATNTYMMRWFQSKESSAIYISDLELWVSFLAYSLFFNKWWKVSISWTFSPILREFEVRLNNQTARENGFRLGFGTWLHSVALFYFSLLIN